MVSRWFNYLNSGISLENQYQHDMPFKSLGSAVKRHTIDIIYSAVDGGYRSLSVVAAQRLDTASIPVPPNSH